MRRAQRESRTAGSAVGGDRSVAGRDGEGGTVRCHSGTSRTGKTGGSPASSLVDVCGWTSRFLVVDFRGL